METALDKIRPHTSSSLAHQKAPATLLLAIESTLDGQGSNKSPTAYFATLLTLLESTIEQDNIQLGEGDILPAQLYLLALVAPFTPASVIRSNLSTLLRLTAPLFPILGSESAPALRSQLGVYNTLLTSLDRGQLDTQSIRQCFASILDLCVDPRPKIRKRAQEVVREILSQPPPPLSRHPYSERVTEWTIKKLGETSKASVFSKEKSGSAETAIHVLTLLRPCILNLTPSLLPSLTSTILCLPRLGNSYLSQSAYGTLAELFLLSKEATTDFQSDEIIDVILTSPPAKGDVALSSAWMSVLGHALQFSYTEDSTFTIDQRRSHAQQAHSLLSDFLGSSAVATRSACVDAYGRLAKCLNVELVQEALVEAAEIKDKNDKPKTVINKIVTFLSRALDSVSFAQVHAIPSVLEISRLILGRLGYFSTSSSLGTTSAAEKLFIPFIQQLSTMRIQKSFEHKEAVDLVLESALRVLGPHVIFRPDVLPLNLIPRENSGSKDKTGRAFLLPLLPKSHSHPSPMKHFVESFVPLSEKVFESQQAAENDGRETEAKVWSVLLRQIWSGLESYARGNVGELSEALTPQFAQLLSQVAYSQPDLRTSVFKTLKILVDSSANAEVGSVHNTETEFADSRLRVVFYPGGANFTTKEQSLRNHQFLKSQTESWLAVLFNVYGSLGSSDRESNVRQIVGETISSFFAIADDNDIEKAFAKVYTLFKGNLPKGGSDADNTTLILSIDILLLVVRHLSCTQTDDLFEACLSPTFLTAKDNAITKRSYRLLGRIIEAKSSTSQTVDSVNILRRLGDIGDEGAPGAKKDRIHLLRILIPLIPSNALHIIPSLIPEAVLGTKDPAEKSRNEAFELLVDMGQKMQAGGIVNRGMINADSDQSMEDTTEASASTEEYMKMLAGGLAGASQHMISATITAIARLVFEFKDDMSTDLHSEILSTILVFLNSASREIVKSTLGYVKLAVHSLPQEVLKPQLDDIVKALMRWSGDRKNHFKVKVRHVLERILRRFSWDEVYACVESQTGDDAKILVNIKKRKDRAKRKKAMMNVVDDDAQEISDIPERRQKAGDAFEDVLYGSESELDDGDDEDEHLAPSTNNKDGNRSSQKGARLRLDDDEPMDLLRGGGSNIIHGEVKQRRQPGKDASRFKTDENSGKMIIDDDEEGGASQGAEDVDGNAYKEGMTSVDGFTRGPGGRVKFNKDTKKRRQEDMDNDGDIEMGEAKADSATKPSAKKVRQKDSSQAGSEFKSRRAGGDVKKGGVDPYAYLTLSQAGQKKGRGAKLGIAGKRRK